MAFLSPDVQQQVREAFSDLVSPVKLVVFTQGAGGTLECDFCAETRQLVEEVGALSDLIDVEVRDFQADADAVGQYLVDKSPAVAVLRGGPEPQDDGLRFYGIPSGYEFASLIEAIRLVSRGEHGLSPRTLEALARLDRPMRIQVFVTPTCPHCPRAVTLAHRLALASRWVRAEMVEANEFAYLANRYDVYGVPRTVIDEHVHIEGAVPEAALVAKLMAALQPA